MVLIDGEAGEGGGQVLRTALGLSLVTQTLFASPAFAASGPSRACCAST